MVEIEKKGVSALAPITKAAYMNKATVASYAAANYLTDVERDLLKRHFRPGFRVLDLGVGGGRTTPFLAPEAKTYIGVDYSEAMVDACKKKFPKLRFEVMDASDLSSFQDGSFDFVVFSFNGMGNLYPCEKRRDCLSECRRVLTQDGVLIFSLHHARSLYFTMPTVRGISDLRPFLGSVLRSARRFLNRVWRASFWLESGYLYSGAHGGIVNYVATPKVVNFELERSGFEVIDILGDGFPKQSRALATRWYYYAAKPKI